MNELTNNIENKSSTANRKMKPLHFVGFGGAGTNIIKQVKSKGVQGKFTCISEFEKDDFQNGINFISYQRPAGQFEYLDYDMPFFVPEEIMNIFCKKEKYALFCGLGGYTGSNFVQYFIKKLSKNDIPFLAIVCKPFPYEGPKRKLRTEKVINDLQHYHSLRIFELKNLPELYGNMNMREAMEKANNLMFEIYEKNSFRYD